MNGFHSRVIRLIVFFVVGIPGPSFSSLNTENSPLDFNSSTDYKVAQSPWSRPELALKDPDDRIDGAFEVSKRMRRRVGFWFDIYTKYTSAFHVIHHTRFPWIIYDVVDTRSFYKGPGNYWTNYHRAQRFVKKRKARYKRALQRLAKRKSFRKLRGIDKKMFEKLKYVRGPRRKVFKTAARQLRDQVGQKNFLVSGINNSPKYLPYIEKQLTKNGLPTELARIPFVESSFNEKAQSRVGASGIWQIMPMIGRHYLKMSRYIDERNSPFKATEAAIQLFKQNKRALKSWPLTVTAYNHGIGGLRKALRHSRSQNLEQVITRYHQGSFKFASANFYASFLAVLHAEQYHDKIFHDLVFEKAPPMDLQLYRLERRLRPKDILKMANLTESSLLEFNMDVTRAVKANRHLPKGFTLFLPPEAHRRLTIALNQPEEPKTKVTL